MNAWIHGLGAALIGGLLSGAAQAAASGGLNKATLINVAVGAGVGALTAAVAYLKQSPIQK